MNSSFNPSEPLDTAVAASANPTAAHHPEPSDQPHAQPPASAPLDHTTLAAVHSIDKLHQDVVVTEVDVELANSTTNSSPKRPRSAEAPPPIVIPSISDVVGTSAIGNGVDLIESDANDLSNHVHMSIVAPPATDSTHPQGEPHSRPPNSAAALPVSADNPPPIHLDSAVHAAAVHAVALTVDPATDHQQAALSDLMPAATTAQAIVNTSDLNAQQQQPQAKRRRKTYHTEEERRQARILKNRRTAEESRQRRLKRMKELEEIAAKAAARERELLDQIRQGKEQLQEAAKIETSLRTILHEKEEELAHKDSELAQKEAELVQRDDEVQRLHDKLAMK
ncbi:hypothetical protein BWQ96_09192 [Gracilariopsis chorda]|uniref:BZIP domain-containing protein n=1 Tax=Gracilariopsis chorda TaxID=448386 RepID=A0A2V3IGC6_9FLOR|nr:hypothetical protein BWQ96_09192 [Gracilariopsis chorda]|eukprot:PXF41088.1 hypothetical protein BWQ96_09192 [Gracilariopsis chorda]